MKTIYRALKNAGITSQIKHYQIFRNDITGEKGWRFELKNGTKGKLILGKGLIMENNEVAK